MNSFVARTRVRGEIGYCKARWTKSANFPFFMVRFLEGEHKGEEFAASDVAIAADDKHLLGKEWDEGTSRI